VEDVWDESGWMYFFQWNLNEWKDVDGQVDVIQDDGSHKCIIRGKDDQQWKQPRRLAIVPLWSITNRSYGDLAK